jgi:hypothetical protein
MLSAGEVQDPTLGESCAVDAGGFSVNLKGGGFAVQDREGAG